MCLAMALPALFAAPAAGALATTAGAVAAGTAASGLAMAGLPGAMTLGTSFAGFAPAAAATAATGGFGLSTLAQLAGTALNAVGSIQEANAAADAAEYNAAIARQNAILSERRAEDALDRGDREEKQARLRAAKLAAEQRVGFAGGGVTSGSGSPLSVVEDTVALGELDALTIRNNAQREAFEFEVDAFNFNASANAGERTARNRRRAGIIGGASTALGGALTLADRSRRLRGIA